MEEQDLWAGGYDDGLSDAENVVRRLEDKGADEIVRELRKLRGWINCPACGGTGKNTNPTHRDLLFALMQASGATVSPSPLRCQSCCGEAVVRPKAEARRD